MTRSRKNNGFGIPWHRHKVWQDPGVGDSPRAGLLEEQELDLPLVLPPRRSPQPCERLFARSHSPFP